MLNFKYFLFTDDEAAVAAISKAITDVSSKTKEAESEEQETETQPKTNSERESSHGTNPEETNVNAERLVIHNP